MRTKKTRSWHSPPIQKRAQETEDRIVAVTEELLREKDFEDIHVAEIAVRAEASLGSFYLRFSSKNALLSHIYARYARKACYRVRMQLSDRPPRNAELPAQCES